MNEESADELSQESFLHMFKIKDEDDLITVITNYPKAGHEHRDKVNREYVEIELDIICQLRFSNSWNIKKM